MDGIFFKPVKNQVTMQLPCDPTQEAQPELVNQSAKIKNELNELRRQFPDQIPFTASSSSLTKPTSTDSTGKAESHT